MALKITKYIITVELLSFFLLKFNNDLWFDDTKTAEAYVELAEAQLWDKVINKGRLSNNIEDRVQGLNKVPTQLQVIFQVAKSSSGLMVIPIKDVSSTANIVHLNSLISGFEAYIQRQWKNQNLGLALSQLKHCITDTYHEAILSSLKISHDLQTVVGKGSERKGNVYLFNTILFILLFIVLTIKVIFGSLNHKQLKKQIITDKEGFKTDLSKQSEKMIELTNELVSQKIAMDSHSLISMTDIKGKIIYVNDKFCAVSGYSREQLMGSNHKILNSGNKSKDYWQQMYLCISKGKTWSDEIRNKSKSGSFYWVQTTIVPRYGKANELNGYVSIRTDITKNKEQQEQLGLMAHYDLLTGLPNRALFIDRFNQSISHSKRTDKKLAVCFVDLDNFKPVNDNYGHDEGDRLLVEVAQRIKAKIREEDTVSRQGGDEFALLFNDIENYTQFEQTINRIQHALSLPYIIDDNTYNVTASIGATLYPEDNSGIDVLLRHADQAMYQAKLIGKNCWQLFNTENDQRNIQKHHRLHELEQALSNNDFKLYYQPKVNMATGEVFGLEALIRWIHPKKGLIPPLDFLPALADTDLEISVGNWVVNEALSQLEIWQEQGLRLEISVNISSHHLCSHSFFDHMKATLAKYPFVDSQCFQIEILESSALGNLNTINTIVKSCQQELGIKVALDDFGTGYSSLTHLRKLPVDIIKIDRSFVRGMLDDPGDYSIIEGIIGLADSFNRQVIAEGVETTNQGLMLLMMGCEEAQGYGIAKPMPADDFSQWLQDYIPNQDWQHSGNKYRSNKESKVKLFKLCAENWQNRFINNIQSPDDEVKHWPTMISKQCHCGSWIKRAKQEQLIEVEGLKQLDKAHEAYHLISQAIYLQYQNGNLDAARAGLTEHHFGFDKMMIALRLC